MTFETFKREVESLIVAKGAHRPTPEAMMHWYDRWFKNFDDEVFVGACRGLETSTERFSFPDLLGRCNASPKVKEQRQKERMETSTARCPKCDGVGYIVSTDDGVSDPLKIHADDHTRATRCRCEAGQRKSSHVSFYADEYGMEPVDVYFHHYSETPEEGLEIAKDAIRFVGEKRRGRRDGEMTQAMEAGR